MPILLQGPPEQKITIQFVKWIAESWPLFGIAAGSFWLIYDNNIITDCVGLACMSVSSCIYWFRRNG